VTNYRGNLAFSEASFEMIIVITPEKEADLYNDQFSYDHTIATEKIWPEGDLSVRQRDNLFLYIFQRN